jgi:hypothetical protein
LQGLGRPHAIRVQADAHDVAVGYVCGAGERDAAVCLFVFGVD